MLEGSSSESTATNSKTRSHSSGRWLLYRMLLSARRKPGGPADQAGLSLLECLVAIAVIVLSLSVILPPLLVATASRIQNRRAEQAFQVAQAEVDRIQALVEQDRHTLQDLPPAMPGLGTNISSNPAPTGPINFIKSVSTCPNPYRGQLAQLGTVRNAVPVDIDGDCRADFFMQVFIANVEGLEASPTLTDKPDAFRLGVRVYSNVANGNWGRMTDTTPAGIQTTSGFGQQATRPLVTLYPQIVSTNTSASLCDYQRNLPNTTPNACQ